MKQRVSTGLKWISESAGHRLWALDQTLLPHQEVWLESQTPEDMVALIQRLAIRGAPLIGVAAAMAIAKYAETGANTDEILAAARLLRNSRPTAVNLMAAMDRLVLNQAPEKLSKEYLIREAEAIYDEDVALSEAIAQRGAALIQDGDQILTHCNTGGLATVGVGTALGAVIRAHERGKKIHVYVDETRPLLQGARLTTWELAKNGIPYTLISDNMAGFLMSQGKVNRIFTGADRIAANGDSANKIGTYSLAVLAKYHGVPFYIVAPSTTVDKECPSGKQIPIELRKADEVRAGKSPVDCPVWNPAFDVTPMELITGIVLEDRIQAKA